MMRRAALALVVVALGLAVVYGMWRAAVWVALHDLP